MGKTNGVTFGAYHSYDDWGLILAQATIGLPPAKTNTVEVPGADGVIDLTEALTSEVAYGNRTLTFVFDTTKKFNGQEWANLLSTIAYQIHGRKVYITLDDDQEWRYYGRCEIDRFETNREHSQITLVCDCDPYKYNINSPGSPWLWDPFSFVDGVIYTERYDVDGTLVVSCANRAKRVVPTFTCSSAMTVTINGTTYQLRAGQTINYDISFGPDETVELTFKGSGTVSISYEEGII